MGDFGGRHPPPGVHWTRFIGEPKFNKWHCAKQRAVARLNHHSECGEYAGAGFGFVAGFGYRAGCRRAHGHGWTRIVARPPEGEFERDLVCASEPCIIHHRPVKVHHQEIHNGAIVSAVPSIRKQPLSRLVNRRPPLGPPGGSFAPAAPGRPAALATGGDSFISTLPLAITNS